MLIIDYKSLNESLRVHIDISNKSLYIQSSGSSSSHAWMWKLERLSTEKLMLPNYAARDDSWESLRQKESKLVNPKGNQPWVFIGRTDAKIEAPILWPCDAKSWLIGKDPDAGKHWGQEERGATEDEFVW